MAGDNAEQFRFERCARGVMCPCYGEANHAAANAKDFRLNIVDGPLAFAFGCMVIACVVALAIRCVGCASAGSSSHSWPFLRSGTGQVLTLDHSYAVAGDNVERF